MEAVLIMRGTTVHIKGIPVRLATDVIVETAYGDMAELTGYHYAHLHESDTPTAESGAPPTPETKE